MTLGRTVSRGLIPLSVFALLGSGLALHDPLAEVNASVRSEDVSGTPAVVRDTAVETVDPAEQAPVDPEAAPEADAAPEGEALPEAETAPEGETAPEAEEPETLAAPEDEGNLDEGHGEEGHVHVTDGVVVAELEPRDLEPFSMLGVTWSGGIDPATSRVEARWRAGGTWSAWTELHVEGSTEGVPGTEPQWVGEADAAAVRVISTEGAQPQEVALSTIDPGQVPDVAPVAFATASTSGVPKPRIITRASWGASGGTRCDGSRPGATMKGVVIHHTAGNNNYSKSQSAAIVKATQAYHTGSRKWCDIGYNFLVDKYGQIFEGRAGGVDKLVRAAHSGNGPVNEDTAGISMMGTFSTTAPSAALKSAVANLTAWKFAVHKIPATGTYSSGGVKLNRIAGHRNVVGTECPGNAAYSWVVSGLRSDVGRLLAGSGQAASPSGLKVTGVGAESVSLDWADVSGAKLYQVQVSASSSMASPAYREYSSSAGTVSRLRGVEGRRYYLRVRVLNPTTKAALSAFSPIVSSQVSTAKPSGLKVTDVVGDKVTLDWADVSGARRYEVQVSTSSSMSSPAYRTYDTSGGTVARLRTLPLGNPHYLRVRVVDPVSGAGLSGYSAIVKAEPAVVQSNSKMVGGARSVTFKGHGFGHGIGMSQYGARGGALQGATASQILARYYPGTKVGAKSSNIRVLIGADSEGSTEVAPQSNLRFRQGSTDIALPTSVSGRAVSIWQIRPWGAGAKQSALRYKSGSSWYVYQNRVWTGTAAFSAPTVKLILPGGVTTATYRTMIQSVRPTSTSTSLRSVNVLSLEDYTRGVVAREVPASWPIEAVKAQSIAARTYGARSISASGYYDICDTTSCQVYGGVSAEDSRTSSAVTATSKQVLMYGSDLALTQFSSSSGGFTQTGSQPYLKAVADPWDGTSGNPNHDWSQSVSVSAIERANPSIGSLQRLDVVKRNGHGEMGGRAVSLKLTGSKGSVTVTGPVARFSFGLKSDWFGF